MWRPASLPNRNIKKLQLVLGSLFIHDVAISLCFTEDCLEMIKFHDLLEQPLFCYLLVNHILPAVFVVQ